MMSLGVELGREHNGMKDEIEEVMLEGIKDNELTAGVYKRCMRSYTM